MSSEIVISAKNVSKMYEVYNKPSDRMLQFFWGDMRRLYKEFWALNDISFEVRRGETIGVLGRNGSGKSTLLQIIAGTLAPTSGEISINGKITALLELGAGFNPEFTGRENIFLNASIFGLSHETISGKFDEIAAFADIGEFIEQPVKTYSSGMYARLAFAVAISLDPEILVVDEILAVGDVFFQARCMRKLDEFRESGGTVFFVTHDTYAVEKICTRAIVLHHGKKVFEGATADGVNVYYRMSREEIAAKQSIDGAAAESSADDRGGAVSIDGLPVAIRRDHAAGDGSAYIEEVYISGTDNVARSNFAIGEWMVVTMVVRFNADFERVEFGVGLRDKNGTLVGGAHTFYNDSSVGNVRSGERRLFIAHVKLDVSAKEYLLVAGVAKHQSIQSYQECYGLYDFAAISVTGNRKFWGDVALPGKTIDGGVLA